VFRVSDFLSDPVSCLIILNHLDSCSEVICIVTASFQESVWVNQEAGIAIGKGKPVVPLILGGRIPGFPESAVFTQSVPDWKPPRK